VSEKAIDATPCNNGLPPSLTAFAPVNTARFSRAASATLERYMKTKRTIGR